MIAALLAGWLAVALLATVRLRPDPRLRDAPITRGRPARRWPTRARATRPGDLTTELASWCDALAREVRSGTSLVTAVRSHDAPAGTVVATVRRRLDRGDSLADALSVAPTTADEQAILTVLDACARHGGPTGEPLDRVAATLRRRAADAAERRVQSAQARLSAQVMTVLPSAVLVLLIATSTSVRSVVLTAAGVSVMVLGLVLNGLGWWWMRRIVRGPR